MTQLAPFSISFLTEILLFLFPFHALNYHYKYVVPTNRYDTAVILPLLLALLNTCTRRRLWWLYSKRAQAVEGVWVSVLASTGGYLLERAVVGRATGGRGGGGQPGADINIRSNSQEPSADSYETLGK